MAKDGLFFKKTGTLNKYDVPEFGLWIQCIVASLLCLSGRYGNLLDMISFVVVLFYALTILGIFVLRKKRPDAERPYKAFGYPLLPALYILMAITFCALLIYYKPTYAIWGLIIVLAGIPIYYVAVANKTVSYTHLDVYKRQEWESGYRNLENQKNGFVKKHGNAITQQMAEEFQTQLMQQQQRIDEKKQSLTQRLSEKSYRTMDEIQKQLKDFLAEYNKQKNYTYILTTGTGLDYMVYKDSSLNITADVVSGMNDRLKKDKK